MKKSEIRTGVEYVVSRSAEYDRYGDVERVKVVGRPLSTQERTSWSAASSTRTVWWVPVHVFRNGEWDTHEGQKRQTARVREEWAPYAERVAERRRARIAAQRTTLSLQTQRAALLADLIPALRHSGIVDTTASIYRGEAVIDLLRSHIPDCLSEEGEGALAKVVVTAPLAGSIPGFVKDGKPFMVNAEALMLLATQR